MGHDELVVIVAIGGVGGEGVVVGEGGAWFLRHDRDVVVIESRRRRLHSFEPHTAHPVGFFSFRLLGRCFEFEFGEYRLRTKK